MDERINQSSEGNVDNNDPVIEKLYNESDASSVGRLLGYPNDILSDDRPGHFIMIQAYDVEGINVEKFKEILSLKRELADIDDTIQAQEDYFNDPLIQGPQETLSIAERERVSTEIGEILGNSPLLDRETETSLILDQNNSLTSRFSTTQKVDFIGRRKTLQDTIVLYMPPSMQAAYSMDYSLEENSIGRGVRAALNAFSNFTATGNISNVAGDGMKVLRDLALSNPQTSSALAGAGLAKAGGFGALGGAIVGYAGANLFSGPISSLSRRVVNPHMEFLFKSINQRTFQYSFNFIPKSKEEADMIHEIIKSLKKHSHPEVDEIAAFLKMPSEFEITFYSNMKENRYVNRVLPCALTNIEVDYTPDSVTSFHKDDGDEKGQSPTRIAVNLTFSEVALLDKRHIEAGY